MKPRRKERQYSLLIVRDDGRVRRVRLRERALWGAAAVVIVFALALAALLVDYAVDKRRLARGETGGEAEVSTDGVTFTPKVMAQLEARLAALAPLERFFLSPSSRRLGIPDQWPLHGWPTSGFGMRRSPFTDEPEIHVGIDIAAPIGRDVTAPAAGVVLYTGDAPGYGQTMIVQHGHGFSTRYGHLDRLLAQVGQSVQAGEVIARSGNSGQSTGPHLHYEVRLHNVPVDPLRYLPAPEPLEPTPEPAPELLDVPTPPTEPTPTPETTPTPEPTPELLDVPSPPTGEPPPTFGDT